jgi:excinuclease ABC subunit C
MDGKDMVGVMTVFESGEPRKEEYRKFKIKTLSDANDPAALKEVVERRLNHPEWTMPQIIVVDGAIAQKNAVESVLKANNVVIPVVAVVKDDKHKPIRLMGPAYLLTQHKEAILHANAESHRFAITYHRSKRDKIKRT